LEHGGLPKSLEDLKGKYLDQLPVTPYAGTRFGYEPHGLLHYATWRIPTSTATVTIDPGQPFIDCDSWPTIPDGPGSAPVLRRSEWPEGSTDAASPKTQVWRDGWVFPIP
ncbi:MAG: hypothetical protein ABSG53_00850, partial [Thermoguttaceae bacterium]